MITLDKKDLGSLFVLLAILYFLDSVLGGFLVLGVVVAVLMLAEVWLNDRCKCGMSLKNSENIFRIAVAVLFLGVLVQTAWLIAIGMLIGTVLMFLPIGTLSVDLSQLKLSVTAKAKSKTRTRRRRR
ncbi:MAG: hypothetical protein ABSD68_04320 [Candidatus Micrarchaeales archaeon]|jgi:chromate transport protein ChrA